MLVATKHVVHEPSPNATSRIRKIRKISAVLGEIGIDRLTEVWSDQTYAPQWPQRPTTFAQQANSLRLEKMFKHMRAINCVDGTAWKGQPEAYVEPNVLLLERINIDVHVPGEIDV